MCFLLPLEYIIKKLPPSSPVPKKGAKVILIKAKLCSAVLRMLLVAIYSYLKSVLRYTFLIWDTYQPGTLCEQGCEGPWLFFEAILGPRERERERERRWKHCYKALERVNTG